MSDINDTSADDAGELDDSQLEEAAGGTSIFKIPGFPIPIPNPFPDPFPDPFPNPLPGPGPEESPTVD